ncbi:ABC-2 type transport system permease protein [Nocardioides albertanoniae]|uniref:Transport permease protein n=1 Tax=Nocardioides albertanoniae TaxID=1175486 RepID=A0A543AAK6_9ACTN|nr:ABC transporter permease [Nocardioides albertanoniae]TQL69631.1 ABC-2 type transport system permease protein [Nocardioides albertanoniae]
MSATTAVLRSEGRLFVRDRASLFWILAFPTLLLVIFGLIPSFREAKPDLGGRSVFDLYVPICVMLAMIAAGLLTFPISLMTYRESGVLRRLRTTPVGPASIVFAQLVLYAAAIVISTVIVFVVATLGFGSPMPASMSGYLVAYALCLVTSLGFGALVAAVTPNTKIGQVIGMCIFFPALFTAGVYVPVETFSGWLRTVVTFSPYGAGSNAFNDAVVGSFPEWSDLAIMGGWAVLLLVNAVRFFRWE